MLLGIGLFSVLTANIAAFFVEGTDEDGEANTVTAADLDARLAGIEALLTSTSSPAPVPPTASDGNSHRDAGVPAGEAS